MKNKYGKDGKKEGKKETKINMGRKETRKKIIKVGKNEEKVGKGERVLLYYFASFRSLFQ